MHLRELALRRIPRDRDGVPGTRETTDGGLEVPGASGPNAAAHSMMS
jgi:hypothetical protein